MFARYPSLITTVCLKFFQVKMVLHEKISSKSLALKVVLFLDTTIICGYAEVLYAYFPFP